MTKAKGHSSPAESKSCHCLSTQVCVHPGGEAAQPCPRRQWTRKEQMQKDGAETQSRTDLKALLAGGQARPQGTFGLKLSDSTPSWHVLGKLEERHSKQDRTEP